MDIKDYTAEYRDKIRPEINRRLKRVFVAFIVTVVVLLGSSKLITRFGLPDKLFLAIFFLCAAYYLKEILSFTSIKCPHCEKPLFVIRSIRKIPILNISYSMRRCPHCGVNLR